MRYTVSAFAVGFCLLASGAAGAQGRPMVRPVTRPGSPPPQTHTSPGYQTPPPAPGSAAPGRPGADQMCASRRNVLTTEEKRLESYQSELVGIDSEMAQLTRRLDDLRRHREELQRNVSTQQSRTQTARNIYNKDCSATESCSSYESQAQSLDVQTDAIERDLNSMRDEIRGNRQVITQLEQRISPLQREYAEKRCNNLVPGETDQMIIDRCTAIFSDWNRLQADLNRQNSRVPQLKSGYEQLFAQLKSLESRANSYEQYLARNCSSSPETAKMRGYTTRRQQAQTVGQELDSLIGDITKLRGVKITVTAQ